MKRIFLTGIAVIVSLWANAQGLSLDTCYALAQKQYPLIKQRDLIEKSRGYNVSNAGRGYLPQVSFNGQGTYQSAVTSLSLGALPKPFNDISFPTPNKAQYNVHGELDQTIYDGGIIKDQKQMDEADADIQKQNVEVELYAIRDRIDQIFFGALLIDEQIKQNDLTQKDIQSSIDQVKAGVANGTALSSDEDELQAELLQQQQNKIQLQASRKAYMDMLGLFINKPLDENTTLQAPGAVKIADSIKRPEVAYYDIQKKSYDAQDNMLNAGNMPKLSFFFQGGVADPGLNAFDTKSEPYYITGFRFTWNIGGFYTLKNSRELLTVQRQMLDVEKETFLFNTKQTLKQQGNDIIKLQQMLSLDKDIVAKRTIVLQASKAKLDNGTITTHEYLTELDAKDQAEQALLLHEVQLLMSEYGYQNTSGN
jgi:outer membrane protein TolC